MNIKTTQVTPRPLERIARFEQLGYGMFIHWGLYSQLGQGEWIQHNGPVKRDEYAKLFDTFTGEDFDADAWCRLATDAGMKYLCLTTRHHEGFSLYDTRGLSSFDAMNAPSRRDFVGEFIEACRKHSLLPMLYHTTMDWYWRDTKTYDITQPVMDEYLEYLNHSVEILCTEYGEIGGLWFDGNWCRHDLDWKVDSLYALIRKHQPEAIIVNNTGLFAQGALGHPEVDSVTFEQGEPVARDQSGQPKYVAGEMCQTMNQHWGIGAKDYNYLAPGDVIRTLSRCRKIGANYLLNVGPTAQGGIPEYEAATLRRVGSWIRHAGEVIYQGRPCPHIRCHGEDFILRTDSDDFYFAFNLSRHGDEHVTLAGGGSGPRAISGYDKTLASFTWLDSGETPPFTQNSNNGIVGFEATGYPYGTDMVVRVARLGAAD